MKRLAVALALLAASPAFAQAPQSRAALMERWGVAATEDAEQLAERNRSRRPELLNRVTAANPGQDAKVVPIVRGAELCIARGSANQTRLDALEVAAGFSDAELLAMVEYYEEVRRLQARGSVTPAERERLNQLAERAPLEKLEQGLGLIQARGLSDAAAKHARGCIAEMNAALTREGLNRL